MRNLQAYFESMCEAHKAAAALAEAGYGKAHLDLAGALDYEYSEEISSPKTGSSISEGTINLAGVMMSLWSRGLYDSKATAAANTGTQISEIGCEEGELKISTRLVLKISDDSADTAFKIISKNGGRIFPSTIE